MGLRNKFLKEDRPKAEKRKEKFLAASDADMNAQISAGSDGNAEASAYSPETTANERTGASANASADSVTKTEEKAAKKKSSTFSKLSAIWSVISALYVTVAVAWFIIKNGLDGVVPKVLLGMLAAFVAGYITVVAISASKNRENLNASKNAKTYKKCLKIFKAVTKVVFVAMSGVLLAGMNLNGLHGALQWVAFIATFVVALFQLVLMIVKMIFKARRKHIKEKYNVKKQTFKK